MLYGTHTVSDLTSQVHDGLHNVKDSKGKKLEVFPFGVHKTLYRLLLLQQQTMKEQCFHLNEESICSLDDEQKNQTKIFQNFSEPPQVVMFVELRPPV